MFGKSKPPIDRGLAAEQLRAGIEALIAKALAAHVDRRQVANMLEGFADRERRCFAVSAPAGASL